MAYLVDKNDGGGALLCGEFHGKTACLLPTMLFISSHCRSGKADRGTFFVCLFVCLWAKGFLKMEGFCAVES